MAYISYKKLWEREFDNIVSKKDEVQDLNTNQLKLQVHDSYKNGENVKTNFEPTGNSDVISKAYLDENYQKQMVIYHYYKKNYIEFKLLSDKQSIEEVLIQRAVKTTIQILYEVHENELKNEATSNVKLYQMLYSLSLNFVKLYLGNEPFSSDIGIVNLHPTKGTHWVTYINEKYFDSYRCVCPEKLSRFFIKRNGHCSYYKYKTQGLTSKKESYCAAYCLYKIYLTKFLQKDSKIVALNLNYEMTQYCLRFL